MKLRNSGIMLLILMVIPIVSLYSSTISFGYPDIHETFEFSQLESEMISVGEIEQFLNEWQPEQRGSTHEHVRNLIAESTTINRLESIYRMQVSQTDKVKRDGLPVFSLISDPANPVYGFSRMYQINSTTPPPAETLILAHQFGLGASLSQQLPTAGSLDITVRHAISSTSIDGGNFMWNQSPSLSVSLQQPLGIGNRIIDAGYGKKLLEKQLIQQEEAFEGVHSTGKQLELQVLELFHAYEALLESRWLLAQQRLLGERAFAEASLRFTEGLLSKNELIEQQVVQEQLALQIQQFDNEIVTLKESLNTLTGGQADQIAAISHTDILTAIQTLRTYLQSKLPNDPETVELALRADSAYMTAQRNLQLALLDAQLGNPGDAPRLSVAMQLSPHYMPTPSNTFFDSFDELFTTSKPEISVSVQFIAPDLSRSLSRSTAELAEEAVVQATLVRDENREAVLDKFSAYQRTINEVFPTLALRLKEYQLAKNDVEIAYIKAQAGAMDELSARRIELNLYESVFALWQQLRAMYTLEREVSFFLGR